MLNVQITPVKKHTISPYLYMQFAEPLGTSDTSVDAGWDFLERTWHTKLIEKVQELARTMIRWGGCFASYYHWREAVGPYSERVPVLNHCWGSVPYHNHVGTHEVIELCRCCDAEPLMVVNMESDGRQRWAHPKNDTDRCGTAEEAAAWIDYCNNPDNALRISHGHEQPYNVKYWQIGNETSYDRAGFNLDQCEEVTRRFADAMRKADPSVKLIGWGDEDKDKNPWCGRMSGIDELDMIAFHHHFQSGLENSPLVGTEYRKDYDATWQHLMNAYKSAETHVAAMRAQCGNKRLAITEGHYTLQGRNRNEVLSSWGAGVSYARIMNVYHRNSDVIDIATLADFFGTVWQVNALMMPAPIQCGPAYLQPVGTVMSLFRHHQGKYAADITYTGDIDAVASMDEDKVYIHIANTDRHNAQNLSLDLGGRGVKSATMFYVAQPSDVEITPSNANVFAIQQCPVDVRDMILPRAAVAAIEIELE